MRKSYQHKRIPEIADMNMLLAWLKEHTPDYDWNLKGDPQGITAGDLLEKSLQSEGPFSSLQQLRTELAKHREWFHLTDEEGHQLNSTENIVAADDLWISLRRSPWSS